MTRITRTSKQNHFSSCSVVLSFFIRVIRVIRGWFGERLERLRPLSPPSRGSDGIPALIGPPAALFPLSGRDCARANWKRAARLPESRTSHGTTCGRSPCAHDAGGEGGPDAVPLERQAANHGRPGTLRPHPGAAVVPGRHWPD